MKLRRESGPHKAVQKMAQMEYLSSRVPDVKVLKYVGGFLSHGRGVG